MTDPKSADHPADPLFVSSLRELKWVLATWLFHFIWVATYCGTQGYQDDATPVKIVWGMPSWVFWGIVVPWLAASLFTIWFALTQMKDHAFDDADHDEVPHD
jgi:hypothetical protein